MKTLYLNRHAKSSWAEPHLADFDRPLNKRGKRDAPLMSRVLSKMIEPPQIIYSSPAIRALTTAKILAKGFSYPEEKILEDIKIYDASVSDLMNIIYSTPNDINRIMIFGHNPTFTMVINYLSDKYLDNLPTCGFVQIDFDLESWKDIEGKTGKLIKYEYPKKYL